MNPTTTERPPLLSPNDVARELGVSYKTVYRWIYAGRLEAVRYGRLLRIPRHALDALAQPALEPIR